MGKKKNKIGKLTEEQYFAYIACLKNEGAVFDNEGKMLIPSQFKSDDKENNNKGKR